MKRDDTPLSAGELDRLSRVFSRYPGVRAVYLFGSRVSGRTHAESDIDLAILPSDESVRRRKLDILTDLAREGFDAVSLVFIEGRDLVLDYQAVKANVIVYETPGFDRGEAYSLVVRRYLDFKPFLDVQRAAYKRRLLGG